MCPGTQEPMERLREMMEASLEAIRSQLLDGAKTSGRIEAGIEEIVRRLDKLNGRVGRGEENLDKLEKEVTELKETIAVMKERKSTNATWLTELKPLIYVLVVFFAFLIFRNADLMINALGHSEVKIEPQKLENKK